MELREIPGYPGYYATREGEIYSAHKNKLICMKQSTHPGHMHYKRVYLWHNGKSKQVYVHRAVALAYIDKEPHQTQVNHKDGNVNNNCVSNLEWCTGSENMKHSYDTLGRQPAESIIRPINQYTLDGEYLATYRSIRYAGMSTGTCIESIVKCAQGKLHKAGGFVWRYADGT